VNGHSLIGVSREGWVVPGCCI